MILCFELGMPNNNSWNGRWSGEGNCYARVIDFGRSKKATAVAEQILKEGYYYYNFGDGWGASVTVRQVDSKEAVQIRKKSRGFCGYDWMIQSIKTNGCIKS